MRISTASKSSRGWLDADGKIEEKVYDVALSNGRSTDPDRIGPPLGNTVNVAKANYDNSIGDPVFAASDEMVVKGRSYHCQPSASYQLGQSALMLEE